MKTIKRRVIAQPSIMILRKNHTDTMIITQKPANCKEVNLSYSGRWTYYRKRECPVCSTRKDCRSKGELHFCRHDNPCDDYTFLGHDRNGFGIYKLTDLINQEKQENKEEWLRQKQQEKEQRIKEENARRENSLSLNQRDQELRKLINQLILKTQHEQNLIKRGMGENHIKKRGYVSINQWQKLTSQVNHQLAGVGISGYSLSNYHSGFIVPITNIKNQIIGYQIASDDRESAKYVWASSKTSKRPHGATSHLKEYVREDGTGELPLQVTGNQEGRIILIEGTLKPDVCASLSHDLFIGASGGNFLGSQNQLQETLQILGLETIYYAPDAGSISNPNVLRQIIQNIKLVQTWGYSIKIFDWGQLCDQSKLDYDELLNSGVIPEINEIDGADFLNQYDERLEGEISKTEFERKFKPTIPELTQEYYIPSQQWYSWIEEEEKFNLIFELKRIANQLPKTFKKGFGWLSKEFFHQFSTTKVNLPTQINYPDDVLPCPADYEGKPAPKIIFAEGKQNELIVKLKQLGWSDIAITSFMGSGKSHQIGQLEPSEGSKYWYFDKNHNNVSTPTIRDNYENLFPRHDGIYKDSEGNLKVARTRQQKEQALIPSNCHRADLFTTLAQKGYNPNQTTSDGSLNPICATCPSAFVCTQTGYRGQRKDTLAHRKIRLDLNSAPVDFDYSKDTAIIEESGSQLTRHQTLYLTNQDLEQQLAQAFKNEIDLTSLRPVLLAISDYLSGKNIPLLPLNESVEHPLYGINPENLKNILPLPPSELENIINFLIANELDLAEIIPDSIGNVEKKYRSIAQLARAEMLKEAIAKINQLPVNGLVYFLQIWGGLKKGIMRIVKVKHRNQAGEVTYTERQLKLTIEDTKHQDLFSQFKTRIYLDATFNRTYTAKILGINPNQIIEIQEELPSFKNLTVYNTHLEGLGSNGIPSDACQERLKAYNEYVVEHNQNVSILGFKIWGCDNYWFNHNRGTNKFKGVNYLLGFGLPYPNIGDLQDKYHLLFENESDFESFYEEAVRNEVIQFIGRQRVQLYPEQNFILDLVSTGSNLDWLTDLYGINVINQNAFDLCKGARNAKQKSRFKILEAISSCKKAMLKLTQVNIAKISGLSQQLVNKHCKAFQGGWSALINKYNSPYLNSNSDRCNFNPELDDLFREWLGLDPIEAVQEFIDIIVNQGWEAFKAYINQVSGEIKYRIIGLLTPIFAPDIAKVILDSGG